MIHRNFGWAIGIFALASLPGCHSSSPIDTDLATASKELPAAMAEYKQAGFYWEASDFMPAKVSSSDNAAPMIEKAAKDPAFHSTNLKDGLTAIAGGDRRLAHQRLDPLNRALDLAKAASQKPHLQFEQKSGLDSAFGFPKFAAAKALVQALCAKARLEDADGHSDAGMDDLKAACKLSHLLSQNPGFTAGIVEVACDSIVSKSASRLADAHVADGQYLTKLGLVLADNAVAIDFEPAVRGEVFQQISSARELVDEAGKPGKSPKDHEEAQANLARVLQYWTELGPTLKADRSNPKKLGEDIDKAAQVASQKTGPSYQLLGALAGESFTMAATAVLKDRAQELCTEALIQALKLHAETGSYPKQVTGLPGNSTDPFTGKPLLVKQSGKGIMIYSLGPAMKDLGGKAQPKNSESEEFNVSAQYPAKSEF